MEFHKILEHRDMGCIFLTVVMHQPLLTWVYVSSFEARDLSQSVTCYVWRQFFDMANLQILRR